MSAAQDPVIRTYGNWRRPRSSGIGELGTLATVALFAGFIVFILLMFLTNLAVAAVFGIAGGLTLLAMSVKDRHHRTLFQRMGAWASWRRSSRKGSNLYRSGPLSRNPGGTCQLPGLAAKTQLTEMLDSYGRTCSLVYLPGLEHWTVTFRAQPDGEALVDVEQVDSWVAHWGQWMAQLGTEPGLVCAQVTIETAPDTGARLATEVFGNIDPTSPDVAQAVMREIVLTYPQGSAQIRAWVSLTFSGVQKGRKQTAEEMERLLASRIPGLTHRLQATGAGHTLPTTAQERCEVVRTAFSPSDARVIEQVRAEGEVPELHWSDIGPTAHEAAWDHYRHDGAVSVSWVMSDAPRGLVYSSVLSQLLAPHGDVDRKRVSLIYRPLDPGRAAQIVEKDKRAADFRASGEQRPSARTLMDQAAAAATAHEEAQGAGLVNFGMIVTATVEEPAAVADAVAAIENLSATARLQLRRADGSQDTAFAAGLPLGLVLPSHLNVPQAVREAL